jgi:hypothetical protein
MTDWSGHDGTATSARYRSLAVGGLRGVSPSYERLCLGVAGDGELLAALDTLPSPKRQPNLLLAAVRFLNGPVDAYPPFRAFVLGHWDDVRAVMLARRTQTNEPGRCAVLLPALAALPQPLALLEVGASAGLCLYPDRYAYRYGDGPVLGESPVVLDCAITGRVPVPDALPLVAWRAGLDLNPLDVFDDVEVRWLECLIWPEQRDRFDTLRRAVAIARQDPAPLHAGDLVRDLAPLAATAPAQATLVVFHSAVLAYLDDAHRAAFVRQLDAVRAQRPVVWLSNEMPGVVVDVPPRPGPVPFVLARDGVALAEAGPHGRWLRWFGGTA